jgi:hypothetical protein
MCTTFHAIKRVFMKVIFLWDITSWVRQKFTDSSEELASSSLRFKYSTESAEAENRTENLVSYHKLWRRVSVDCNV